MFNTLWKWDIMKIHRLLTVGLCTTFIVVVGAVSLASAAQWLAGGAPITMALPATIRAEVEFEDEGNGGATITCSFILEGTIGPEGAGVVTEMLTSAGVQVTLSAPLLCKRERLCEESTSTELAPEGLPWNFAATGNATFPGILLFAAKFWMSCLILKIRAEDECTVRSEEMGGSEYFARNAFAGVEIAGSANPNLSCTVGGAGKGRMTFIRSLMTSPSVILSISE